MTYQGTQNSTLNVLRKLPPTYFYLCELILVIIAKISTHSKYISSSLFLLGLLGMAENSLKLMHANSKHLKINKFSGCN